MKPVANVVVIAIVFSLVSQSGESADTASVPSGALQALTAYAHLPRRTWRNCWA